MQKVLEVGLCDIDTFKKQQRSFIKIAYLLLKCFRDYCKKRGLHSDTISNAIKILADYKRYSEIDIFIFFI